MALACQMHESALARLPGNGSAYGYKFSGDPRKGFGATQPGGWHYNILPFIEQSNLHDIGIDAPNDAAFKPLGAQICGVVVTTFICPTRGRAVPYPGGSTFTNINAPSNIARSDYAGNGGNRENASGWTDYTTTDQTGVIYSQAGIKNNEISDGLSNTYLIGERYINPDFYTSSVSSGNDQGWTAGHDFDTFRGTDYKASDPVTSSNYAPRRDRAGIEERKQFGSAHDIYNMALCDGSVRGYRYSISPVTHFRLGNRMDGQAIADE
jgi:hypothetical protein